MPGPAKNYARGAGRKSESPAETLNNNPTLVSIGTAWAPQMWTTILTLERRKFHAVMLSGAGGLVTGTTSGLGYEPARTWGTKNNSPTQAKRLEWATSLGSGQKACDGAE
jgi:hypothetical protein